MRYPLAALLAVFSLISPAWGQNPFAPYDGVPRGARAFFATHGDLRADPEIARLMAAADGDEPAAREQSREQLAKDAYIFALAFNELDSSGAAPAYFASELSQVPRDYHGILARFPDYEAKLQLVAFADRGRAKIGRPPDLVEAMTDHAKGVGGLFWSQALREGAPADEAPPARPSPGSDGQIDWSLDHAIEYREQGYNPVSHQGDVSLAVLAARVPKVMIQVAFGARPMPVDDTHHPYEDLNPVVKGDDPPPSDQEIRDRHLPPDETERLLVAARNGRLVLEGRRDPIKLDAMTKMFTQLFAEENAKGVPPKFGTPMTWSPEFLAQDRGRSRLQPGARASKLLLALSCGLTAKYLPTGREEALIKYALSRPDRSVTYHEIFRKSYELNGGDVYLSLLTLENILSEFWLTPRREERALTRKLSPITNVYDGRGDIYGTWYHFTGIMLYSYATNAHIAGAAAHTESLGSDVLSDGRLSPQKVFANREGAVLGDRLRNVLMRQDYVDFDPAGVDYTDPKVYLDLSEDFRDRIDFVESKELSASLDRGAVTLASVSGGHADCRVELMPDKGSGFDAEKIVVRQGVSLPSGTPARIGGVPGGVKRVRAFVRCGDRFEGVVTAGGDKR